MKQCPYMGLSILVSLCVPGLYYGITICIVSFATAMTVLTLNIHHKGLRGTEVPALVKKICFGYLAKVLCLSLETTTPLETTGVSFILDLSKK